MRIFDRLTNAKKNLKWRAKFLGKRVLAGFVILLVVIGLFAKLTEDMFFSQVDIEDFDLELSEVSGATRKALQNELKDTVMLNRGFNAETKGKFKLRRSNITKEKGDSTEMDYASFYIDSEEYKLSFFVQIYWSGIFMSQKSSYLTRIECANFNTADDTNPTPCVTRNLNEVTASQTLDNLKILSFYDVQDKTIEAIRNRALLYVARAYSNTQTILALQDTIKQSSDGTDLEMRLITNHEEGFNLTIKNFKDEKNWQLQLDKVHPENTQTQTIWTYDFAKQQDSKKHYFTVQKQLPKELKTSKGTEFILRWVGDNKLKINSDYCKEGDKNSSLKDTAKKWLEQNHYRAKDFDIIVMNSCDN